MAKILYALSGCNRGHTSRALAIAEGLRERGHEVEFCGGGTAREVLDGLGEDVLPVPMLSHAMSGNRALYGRTLWNAARHALEHRGVVPALMRELERRGPDLLISDFEVFATRAAERLGLPILSFNHQQVVTETRYPVPWRFAVEAAVTRWTIRVVAPRHALHTLVSSFYFPPLRDPERTTLIAPIIRAAVREARPERGSHYLVYFNQGAGSPALLKALADSGSPCRLYNVDAPPGGNVHGKLTFCGYSLSGFLEDLATCRAVIATAGYTLMSEALYLGKPLLVAPNAGIFEQTLNALYLEQEGLGRAVHGRDLMDSDVRGFSRDLEQFQAQLPRRSAGNHHALAVIEQLLGTRHQPPVNQPLAPSALSTRGLVCA